MTIGASNNLSLKNFGFQRSVVFNDEPCVVRIWSNKKKKV
jgi:hypothetical protein